VEALYQPDHVRHEPGGDDGIGIETARAAAARVHARFPDPPQEEHVLLAEGELVFRRWSFTGIHHAPDGPISSGPVMLDAMTIYRVRDGLLAETWTTADWRGLDLQLAGKPFATDPRRLGRILATSDDAPGARSVAVRAARALAAGDPGDIGALFAPGCIDLSNHGAAAPGHAGLRDWIAARRAAFPVLAAEIGEEIAVAAADWVAVPWTASGRQDGPLPGLPATGREAVWGGQALFRIEHDRVAEFWLIEDEAGMRRRLALPGV
jgi:predicted ester cyclase